MRFQNGYRTAVITLLLLSLLVPLVSAQTTFPDLGPPDARKTRQAIEMFQKAAESGPLELSTNPTSASDQFYFQFSMYLNDNPQRLQSYSATIVRDKDHVAILCRFLDGLPFSYMTDGFTVCLGTQHLGSLVPFSGGYPNFEFRCNNHGGADWNYGFNSTAKSPNIVLDFKELFSGLLSKEDEFALYDQSSRMFYCRGPGTSTSIELAAPNSGCGLAIHRFVTKSKSGTLEIVVGRGGNLPPRYANFVHGDNEIIKAMSSLNIPTDNIESPLPFPVGTDESDIRVHEAGAKLSLILFGDL